MTDSLTGSERAADLDCGWPDREKSQTMRMCTPRRGNIILPGLDEPHFAYVLSISTGAGQIAQHFRISISSEMLSLRDFPQVMGLDSFQNG
jgi:hypothetical protein